MFKPQSFIRPADRSIIRIPLESIHPNPSQPRRVFSQESISELADSIRCHGLLSPLLVRAMQGNAYELIAGERRLKALMQLHHSFADAIVLNVQDTECALIALVENLQREDLHFLDEAEACRRILDKHPITQEKLAASLSCSPSALANRLRLLKLSEDVRAEIRRQHLSERHARALLRLEDTQEQLSILERTAERHMSVKQLESCIDQRLQRFRLSPRSKPSPIIRDNRIIINAVLDTVKELTRIGVHVKSIIEESEDHVDVIVRIPACRPLPEQKQNAIACPQDKTQRALQ